MLRSFLAFSLLISIVPVASTCYGLGLPEAAVIVRPFSPIGRYAGHWGIDLAADQGNAVVALGTGTVSFAGTVVGRRSVTVDHGGGIRTSYSYLASIAVTAGQVVQQGSAVGTAGVHDGVQAFHLSLRSGATYLDPLILGSCSAVPEPGLWLAVAFDGYPRGRDRNPRGHVRPSTHRTPRRCTCGA